MVATVHIVNCIVHSFSFSGGEIFVEIIILLSCTTICLQNKKYPASNRTTQFKCKALLLKAHAHKIDDGKDDVYLQNHFM